MNHASSTHAALSNVSGPINLTDEVWGMEHICLFMKQEKRSLYPVVNAEGFPHPLTNQMRNRRWLAASVRAFFAGLPGCVVRPKFTSVPQHSYEPSTIVTKKKRREVA
jgi:hypothetical protein